MNPLPPDQVAQLRAALRVLATVAPSSQRISREVVARRSDLVWLGAELDPADIVAPDARQRRLRSRAALSRLTAVDQLHRHESLLRVGWAFLTGRDTEGRQVLLPLVSRPAELDRPLRSTTLSLFGDVEVEVVTDRDLADGLEAELEALTFAAAEAPQPDAVRRWLRDAASAAGLPTDELLEPTTALPANPEGTPLRIVIGAAVYLARDVRSVGLADSVSRWAGIDGVQRTSLAAIYQLGDSPSPPPPTAPGQDRDAEVELPLPLSSAQRQVVLAARERRVTTVSGAPGNGKSHTLVGVALDAVARGERVLVATASEHAADVLAELLDRQPGPRPVTFGSSLRRTRLAARLASGLPEVDRGELRAREEAVTSAREQRDVLVRVLTGAIAREHRAQRAHEGLLLASDARRVVPAAFGPGFDHAAAARRLARATARPAGPLSRWRHRRVTRHLGARQDTDPVALAAALDRAWDHALRIEVTVEGGTRLADGVEQLAAAQRRLDTAVGERMAMQADDVQGDGRRAVADLARALRAGRARRRGLLAGMDGAQLTGALPLWVGTLRDIEDLLPRTPALFDLVILDEASQIDQVRAVSALARGARVVVAGDPRQLRHVSFVADADALAACRLEGVAAMADLLDVRRMSSFDVAAAAGPTIWLDEHYRSVPHLIGFSAERFYDRPVQLVTRHPETETRDAIETVHVDPATGAHGEVTAVIELVRELDRDGQTSIGVLSPFRAHADALEAALIEAFEPADIGRLGLRVGTVHAMQGSERDVVVAAIGVTEDADPATRRFAEDPNLFNVMVTRARHRLVVVTGLAATTGGLLGAFLAHAQRPPAPVVDGAPAGGWPADLAAELRAQGVPVRTGYPVGRYVCDLVLGGVGDTRALDVAIHPDGPATHLQRRLLLHRSGWQVVDAFSTRWDGDVVRASLELRSA